MTRFATPLHTQVETLKDTSHRLAAGESAARVPRLKYDELNEVGQSFNTMADALQKQQEELQAFRAEAEILLQVPPPGP